MCIDYVASCFAYSTVKEAGENRTQLLNNIGGVGRIYGRLFWAHTAFNRLAIKSYCYAIGLDSWRLCLRVL